MAGLGGREVRVWGGLKERKCAVHAAAASVAGVGSQKVVEFTLLYVYLVDPM